MLRVWSLTEAMSVVRSWRFTVGRMVGMGVEVRINGRVRWASSARGEMTM